MITEYRRRLGYGLAALLLSAATAYGQGLGSTEVALGYGYVRANAPPGECGCFGMNGFGGEFALGLGHGFSVVADAGANHQGNVNSSGQSLWLVNYLFGPRLSHRSKRWTPFAQFLVGGGHSSGTLYGAATGVSGSANALSYSTGGGLDWNATRHVSVRLFQVEYLNTRLPNSGNSIQNNLRMTAGVVFHFGKK